MAYHITIDDVDVRCDNVADALALARAANARVTNAKAPTDSRPAVDSEKIRRERRPYDQSLAFLVAIKEAQEQGVGGPTLVRAVRCHTTSALGTVVANTRRFLKAAGIDFDATAQKRRVGDNKYWFPGASLDNAILALRNKMMELFPV
jgi:hypothetical protein